MTTKWQERRDALAKVREAVAAKGEAAMAGGDLYAALVSHLGGGDRT